jgi:hypothetical protein
MAVSAVIDAAMQPGCFFVAPELHVTWIAARAETIAWEVFRGRLLDASQTRLQKSFLSWHLVDSQANEPMISVKLDVHERQIYVTRGFAAYQWEGFDAGGGVIDSREVVRWQRELVGTITLADFVDLEIVRDELICLIWQAVVGTSRLPLTSVEAPLPAFTFGQLHYLYQPGANAEAVRALDDWLEHGVNSSCAWCETVKLVEFALRRPQTAHPSRLNTLLGDDRPALAEWKRTLMLSMFNNVSLSPHTHFLEAAIVHVNLSVLLRKVCRHLTAYDLHTFHHRGANYPDALLLDAALRRYVQQLDGWGELALGDDADGYSLRRPLRQACVLRRHYEGHLVPDSPTSPGENARVLPSSHARVPEEQLAQTTRRHVRLYADEPVGGLFTEGTRRLLAKSVRDLEHMDERVEMGMGLFIDRPLGYGKQVGEPDLTPLLAHEAFSPSIARRRWRELKALCDELAIPYDAAALDPLFENGPWPAGLPHTEIADCPRPTAALADVRKVANDFVILRTLPGGVARLLERLSAEITKPFGMDALPRLCLQRKNGVLALYDHDLNLHVELDVDTSKGFISRAGVEWPCAGLRLRQ